MTKQITTGYVITKKVGEAFDLIETSFEEVSTLEFLQKAVGGYIECISLENDVDIWINEEGKINGMKPNTAMVDGDGKMFDVIFGDFVVTSRNEEGDTIPLTAEQVLYFESLGYLPMVATKNDETIRLATLKFDNVKF